MLFQRARQRADLLGPATHALGDTCWASFTAAVKTGSKSKKTHEAMRVNYAELCFRAASGPLRLSPPAELLGVLASVTTKLWRAVLVEGLNWVSTRLACC